MAVANYGIQQQAQQALRQNAETDADRQKRIEMERRLAAYTPSAPGEEELAAQQAADISNSLRMGDKRYQETGPRGKGLLGAGLAWAMDKATGKKKRATYSDQALTSLTADRNLNRLKQARLADDTARGLIGGEDRELFMQDDRQDFASTAGSSQEYENLDTGSVVNVVELRDGSKWETDADNKPTVPFNPRGHIPYVPTAAGGSGAKRASLLKRNDNMQLSEITNDINTSEMGRLFSNPNFLSGASTGGANIFAMGKEFQPMNLDHEAVAVTRGLMDGITVDTIIPLMKSFGANPSEGERKFMERGMPNKNNEPMRWFDWAENKFATKTREIALRNIREGTSNKTPLEVEQRNAAFIRMIQENRTKYEALHGGKPPGAEPDAGAAAPAFSDPAKQGRYLKWLEGQSD